MRARMWMAGCLLALGCSQNKVATRDVAGAECSEGCLKSVAQNGSKPELKQRYCAEVCSCFVDARFTADGEQVKSKKEELEAQMRACIEQSVKTVQWSPADPIP